MKKLVIYLYMYSAAVSAEALLSYNLVKGLPNIYITASSERIGHTWSQGVVYEKNLIEKFYHLLATRKTPFVVFDLGAQTGCFTLLAKFLPHSTWYAFEPLKEASDILKKNLACNSITNVKVYELAAANFRGTTSLKLPAMNAWGLATIGAQPLRFEPVTERVIQCIDLDTFVAEHAIRHVDFMKLDTEGAELLILQGAKKIIMRDRPIILLEYNETNMKQCGVLKSELDAFLEEAHYSCTLISSEDLLCIPNERSNYPC